MENALNDRSWLAAPAFLFVVGFAIGSRRFDLLRALGGSLFSEVGQESYRRLADRGRFAA